MKKTLFLWVILLALVWSGDASAQLVTYDFEGDIATPSAVDGSVSSSVFSRNAGNAISYSTGNPGGSAISGSGWTGVDSGNGKYWEFTVSANSGLVLELASVAFDYRSTTTGPTNWELTVNGSTAGSGSIQNDLGFHSVSTPLNSFSGLPSATIRIHGYGASSGGGALRMDNVSLDGLALTPVPEPSTWMLLAGGSVFLVGRLRRRK